MSDSALSDAFDAIKDLLDGSFESALEGVTIYWGPPTGDDKADELVAIGFGRDGTSGTSERSFTTLGQKPPPLDEDLTVPITVEAIAEDGPDLKPTYLRSQAIAAAVEREIRADFTLGDLVRDGSLRRWDGQFFRVDMRRGHRIFLNFTGTARI